MDYGRLLADTDLARIIAKEKGIDISVVREVLKGLASVIARSEADIIQIHGVVFYKTTQEVVVYLRKYQSEI